MHADHHEWAVHRLSEVARDGAHGRGEPVGRDDAGGRMEQAADDPHDEHQLAAGAEAAESGATDCSDGSRDSDADESLVVHRRQALQLSVRVRDWVGDQSWKALADGEESVVLGDYDGVLEFTGRALLARRVDAVGHSELRQGTAAAGDGNGAWSRAGEISGDSSGQRFQGELDELLESQRDRELLKFAC